MIENGTDLYAVIETMAPECNIIFSEKRRLQHELNWNYNIADVTINIANNEGFGLATAESVMAGTPIIVNVTGGLQDQCGFEVDDKLLTHEDYIKIGSLHEWRKWEGKAKPGPWVTPVWSRALALAGSVPTPYIWDDRVDIEDVAEAIEKMYNTPKEVRKYVYGIHTTRGIENGSENYPVRSIQDHDYKLIWNMNYTAPFYCSGSKIGAKLYEGWLVKVKDDPKQLEHAKLYRNRPEFELYNLKKDRYELKNLVDEKSLQKTKEVLLGELKTWMNEQGDKGIQSEWDALKRLKGDTTKWRSAKD